MVGGFGPRSTVETTMTTFLWVLVVAGGPVLLGAVMAYGMMKSRRLSRRENELRDEAIREMYSSGEGK